MTYAEKLKDPRWQRKRLEIMQRDGFKCRYCKSESNTLNVHHRLYGKGRSPWDYDDHILITLCQECHEKAEKSKNTVLSAMGLGEHRDNEIVAVVAAVAENPDYLTMWGWACGDIARAIHGQAVLEAGGTESASNEVILGEIKEAVFDAIRNLMEAFDNVKGKFDT